MKEKEHIGVSRGGKTTKIHALVDGLGNPIRLIFTGGEVHDSKEGVPLLEGFDLSGSAILGDKAYGTVEILTYIRKSGATVVIPPKSNAKEPWDCDFHRRSWRLSWRRAVHWNPYVSIRIFRPSRSGRSVPCASR